jgi:4-hydroxy-tetrahydrodipicolinate synthase
LAGTNGEGPSLSSVEKRDLAKLGCDLSEGLRVILGISSDSLPEAVWLSKAAAKAGAEAVLVMPPSYFTEASQEGVAQWFERLCEDGLSEVLVYNFPRRTGIRFEPETIARLGANPRVVGFKDSSGDPENLPLYRRCAPGKRLLVGDETLLIDSLEHGWNGTISGASNVLGKWIVEILRDWASNQDSSRAKFGLVLPAIQALRSVAQPGGNKAVLKEWGVLSSACLRLPLVEPPFTDLAEAMRILRPLLS